jgi:hypothetical protein
MLRRVGSCAFENVQESRNVRIHIALRIDEAVANACLGGKVHDNIKGVFFEQGKERLLVGQVAFDKVKMFLRNAG